MRTIPISRFRRELTSIIRRQEPVYISRNGEVILVCIPADEYDRLVKLDKG